MSVTIYHNPRCSKSRETLALLQERAVEPEVILYLDESFSIEKLQTLMQKLAITDAREMMRTKDSLYQELGLDQADVSNEQLLQAIVQHPALLERPIVVNGERAKIGRPPESVLAIL